MVVNNLNFEGVLTLPAKANPPLVVDADAVLALAVAFQGLQMVAIGDAQVLQAPGLVQEQQLPPA